jgi:hypothetical protein
MQAQIESRLADKNVAFRRLLDAAEMLYGNDLNKVYQGIITMVMENINVDSCSLFTYSQGKLSEVLTIARDETARGLRTYPADHRFLYRSVQENKLSGTLFEKTEQEEQAPLICGPIMLKQGEMYGVLAVNTVPFFALKVLSVDLFKLVLDWSGKVISHYMVLSGMKKDRIYNEEYDVFSYNFLVRMLRRELFISKRNNVSSVLALTQLPGWDELEPQKQVRALATVAQIIKHNIRVSDILGLGRNPGTLGLLLTPATREDCMHVIAKLRQEFTRLALEVGSRPLVVDFSIFEVNDSFEETTGFFSAPEKAGL